MTFRVVDHARRRFDVGDMVQWWEDQHDVLAVGQVLAIDHDFIPVWSDRPVDRLTVLLDTKTVIALDGFEDTISILASMVAPHGWMDGTP